MMLWMTLAGSLGMLLQAVVRERSNRALESLLGQSNPPSEVLVVDKESIDRLNRALKKATRLPVIAFGRITPPQRGEDLLRAGDADMIGWARQLIADPQKVADRLMSLRGEWIDDAA